ncbi:MAG: glycosyltransferase family 4 protein [Candidatus Dojkabacteria bacterium]
MSQRRLRVFMLGWEFSPLIAGGLGVVAKSLTERLSGTHGTDVTYVLPRIPSGTKFNFPGIKFKDASGAKPSRIRFLEVEAGLVSPYFSPEINKQEHFSSADSSSLLDGSSDPKKDIYSEDLMQEIDAYARKSLTYAKKSKHDIVHNHDWMTAPAAEAASTATKKPMLMHIHSTEYERTIGNPNQDIFNIERRGMAKADCIIAVSQKTKERIVANYGISSDKIKVVHNAVEITENKYGEIAKAIHKDDNVVLFLARLTAMKGANYLLEAAPKVLKHQPKTKFVFIGKGELGEQLIEQSVGLGIANKVTFTGFLPHEQVDRAYRLADVFIMPSVAEPFGITPLEAIKNGTPVILSKQSGVSEVLQNVLKVDFWDTDELANKIIAILKHGVLAEELANNSRRDLSNISWDEQSRQVFEIYKDITNKYKFNYS